MMANIAYWRAENTRKSPKFYAIPKLSGAKLSHYPPFTELTITNMANNFIFCQYCYIFAATK
jgi:hypothetical protein